MASAAAATAAAAVWWWHSGPIDRSSTVEMSTLNNDKEVAAPAA